MLSTILLVLAVLLLVGTVIVGKLAVRSAERDVTGKKNASPRPPSVKRDNRLRNPRVLALLPHIEAVVKNAKQPLTVNEITLQMAGTCDLPFTRRDVRIGLPALVTNHHTVVRRETRRPSGRRGPHRYAAHSGLRASGPRTAAPRPAATLAA